jgi:hypothetical protein
MSMTKGLSTPNMSAKEAYEELWGAGLNTSNVEALSDLFPSLWTRVSQLAAGTQGHDLGCVAAPTSVV